MEPRKHYFAKIPTIAIFIVMAMSGPLGVLLFILKGIDQKMQKEEQEAARARGDYRADPEPASAQKADVAYGQDVPTAEQKSAKQWHKNIATLCTIMGAVFLFAGVTDAVDIIGAWQILPDPGELFSDIVMAIGGGGALASKCITTCKVIAYEDLGAEALRKLYVEDMPLVVIIDSEGNNLYEMGKAEYLKEHGDK